MAGGARIRRDHRQRANALGRAMHAAILSYNRHHPNEPFGIDDPVSRILENDPDYHPPRERIRNKKREPTQNPGIFTVLAVAERLETTVGKLLGEQGFDIGTSDLRSFRWIVDFLQMRFPLQHLGAAAVMPDEHSFKERDFSYPSELAVSRIDRKGEVAAGPTPIESDFEIASAEIAGKLRTGTLFAAQVRGRSMVDRIRDGDTIVIDTAQTTPRQHEPVAVYVEYQGGVLGYWRAEAGAYFLDKHNPEFASVRLGHPSEWRVLGVITLVQSRIRRQDRPTGRLTRGKDEG